MIWTLDNMTDEILANEGGLVDDLSDSGGLTKYGITLGFAKTHPEFFDMNGDGKVGYNDILMLKPDLAKKAYVQFFYVPMRLSLLPNLSNITMQIFDLSVNVGVRYGDGESEAIKVLQHALGIDDVDGELGTATLAAFRATAARDTAEVLNNTVVAARVRYYTQVVKAHPKDKRFLVGWQARSNKYKV